ncbi:MAG TPA: desulfoferrodoxin [Acidimicrobiia bacterium]|nr:desulfoferrodoxin [Acidimicrobiia bacterium]
MTATKVGTRLRCDGCGTEIIVVKTGDDTAPVCCDHPMVARED